jgi:hypothetical protein
MMIEHDWISTPIRSYISQNCEKLSENISSLKKQKSCCLLQVLSILSEKPTMVMTNKELHDLKQKW